MLMLMLHFYPDRTLYWQYVRVYFTFQSENTTYLKYSQHLCVIMEVGHYTFSLLACLVVEFTRICNI